MADDATRTRIRPGTGQHPTIDDDVRTRIKPGTGQHPAVGEAERTRLRVPTGSNPVVLVDDAGQVQSTAAVDPGQMPTTMLEPAAGGARPAPEAADDIVESALPQGTVVGRYLLLDRIGVGGMGSVYAAYDPELDRKVALKLLHGKTGHGSSGSGHRGRLLREAQAMAKLNHPAIVTVHDVGLHHDQVFMAMEYVDGITMRDWIREKRGSWREALALMRTAGEGLAAAHSAGLVHRDFKPSNVMIGADGRVRVLDFGLARRTERESGEVDPAASGGGSVAGISATELAQGEISLSLSASRSSLDLNLTHAGTILGSPAYMSPEQHMSRETDQRSDQFSFCVALFEALYGERPFVSEDHRTLVYAILEQRIRAAPRNVKVPRRIHKAILRGLSVSPDDRFPSMVELLIQLKHSPKKPIGLLVGGVVAVAAAAATLAVAWPRDVTDEARQQIDAIAVEAREAAAKSLFVYPPPGDADAPTAYTKVLELEAMEGTLARAGDEAAAGLRKEFAGTLVYLGDRYWEKPEGKGFAIDYYAQALVFDESNTHAADRASLTVGQLADLRRKATEADFSSRELAAAEPLLALAEDDESKRKEKLEKMLASPEAERSAATDAKLSALVESAEPEESKKKAKPKPKRPKPRPEADVEVVEGDDGEAPAQKRVASKNKRDPKVAKDLAAQGHAALRAANLGEASSLFHQALSYDRRCGSALIGLSDVHFNKGDRSKAIEYAERAVAVSPRSGGYRITLGDAYFKALRYDDARAEYEAARKLGDKRAARRLEKIERTLGS